MSLQAYRLERNLATVKSGAEDRLGNDRAAIAIWQLASKQAELAHLVIAGYRGKRYAPAAALVRTVLEELTLLAWIAAPDKADTQSKRAIRVVLQIYRDAKSKGFELPSDGENLFRQTKGRAAKKPPSFKDRLKSLDDVERNSPDGKEFWLSHLGHHELLSEVVHEGFLGPNFTDPMTRELLGFEAIVYCHQYLVLGIVCAARLSDQSRIAELAQAAYARNKPMQDEELKRLIK